MVDNSFYEMTPRHEEEKINNHEEKNEHRNHITLCKSYIAIT